MTDSLFPFIASNGYIVRKSLGGYMSLFANGETANSVSPGKEHALREFFQAERDAALGRWRSKEHPDYVVYPQNDGAVAVLDESRADIGVLFFYREPSMISGTHEQVARDYFAAHPEPKPAWHDAKPGEVWVLTIDGKEDAYKVYPPTVNLMKNERGHISSASIELSRATHGRRIWPEGGDES